MVAEIIKEAEQKMKSSIDHLFHELGKLRTGQASVALLDDLMVDYYGNPTPLKQVATLGSPDSHTLTVQPWEASILKDIEKAIQASDLGLTPNNDGKVIRLAIPPLTNERRQQLVKLVKKQAEEYLSGMFVGIPTKNSSNLKRNMISLRTKAAKGKMRPKKSPINS
jgi:ribosome recycling factor